MKFATIMYFFLLTVGFIATYNNIMTNGDYMICVMLMLIWYKLEKSFDDKE